MVIYTLVMRLIKIEIIKLIKLIKLIKMSIFDSLYLHKNILTEMEGPPLTPMIMFMCVYEVGLNGLNIQPEKIQLEPSGVVKMISNNYEFKTQPGWEFLIHEKYKKMHKKKKKTTRKVQGSGYCFNSTIEAVIVLDEVLSELEKDKIYKLAKTDCKKYNIKCFTSTGKTQIPGIICQDLMDGKIVIREWVNFLNKNLQAKISIASMYINLINFKFEFNIHPHLPLVIINFMNLHTIFTNEILRLEEEKSPIQIKHIKQPFETKFTIQFEIMDRRVNVFIFRYRKINLLGGNSFEINNMIYTYLSEVFEKYWDYIVGLPPIPDRFRVVNQQELEEEIKRLTL